MTQKKQTETLQKQAIEEDPSIFQYDEVYDDIQTKRKEEKEAKKSAEARKPKYITKLLETADKRKKEYERRIERQIQKEREAEGEEFKDKESFVTSSYRKKIEEMKEAEELEKREAYLESIGDVTKQQDLSGFYRHLYSQKMGDEKAKPEDEQSTSTKAQPDANKKKNYRKRKSSDEEEEKPEDIKKKSDHLPCNLDADSDFSIESSDSEDEKKDEKPEEALKTPEIKKEKEESPQPAKNGDDFKKPEIPAEVKEEIKSESPPPPPKEKIDIWKKRTVGEVFDQALQRYYERKAAREAA